MKYLLKTLLLVAIMLSLNGCITYEKISQPQTGADIDKIQRFDYMESNWSYLHSRWMRGQTILPEDLVVAYGIPHNQAKDEITEFVTSQYNYNWLHCYLIALYLDETRFYIN